MSDTALSVVVLLFTTRAALERCLAALHRQELATPPEIVVPHDDALADPDTLAARFPAVRFLAFRGRHSPAELRAQGVAAARGAVVALLEDHCEPDPDWCARTLHWHASTDHAALGGAIEKGFAPGRQDDRALNWAIWFTDYSRYMNPQPARFVASVSDTNSSYKRAHLEAVADAWKDEFHENIVNARILARGGTLWLAPDIIVREYRDLSLGDALRDRYAFGRLFAATRVAGVPLVKRLVWAGAALLLPPVLVLRVARNLFGRGRHRAAFLRALPALCLVTSAWMLGEMLGYLTGAPARSLAAAHAA